MKKLQFSFIITKKDFIDVYRTNVRYKYKLQRSMIMSVCLLLFGITMQYVFEMDFGFINTVVFWITVFALIINLLSDYVLPKTAYNNLVINHGEKGSISIDDEGITFVYVDRTVKRKWSEFDSCVESEIAFLLYKKDILTIVMKDKIYTNEVREQLINKINNNKNLKFRR